MSTSMVDHVAAGTPAPLDAAAARNVRSRGYQDYLHRRRRTRAGVVATQLLILAAVLAFWQVGADARLWDPLLTSTPSTIWSTFWKLSAQGSLWANTAVTLEETLLSFAVAMLVGVVIATVIWWSPFLSRVLDPYLVMGNAMPKTALGPIFFIWLGSRLSVYGMAISISLIVTILTVTTGFVGVDPDKIKLLRTFGASRKQILVKAVLPGSLPVLLSAIRVNIGLTLVGVIVGEFLSSKAGLGYMILYGGQIFDLSQVMTAIVMLVVMSAALYAVLVGVEALVRRRWRVS